MTQHLARARAARRAGPALLTVLAQAGPPFVWMGWPFLRKPDKVT
jgi:hypothetical protein